MPDREGLFVGFIGLGCGLPALALVFGFPQTVVMGLGSPSHDVWTKTSESKFGLYMYTVSDILLSLVCGAALLGDDKIQVSEKFALGSTCIHQTAYLAAAIPAFGLKIEHIGSIITAALAGMMAFSPEYL